MKSIFFGVLLIAYGGLFSAFAQRPVLSDAEKVLGLSRLWAGIRYNSAYFDDIKLDWDSLYSASVSKVLVLKDPYDYAKELERIAALVGDGHTYVYHNITPPVEDRITPAPFTTRFVEGKVWVDKVWATRLEEKGVRRGTEVISIDGTDVLAYGEKQLGQYVASSTPQWLYYNVFNSYELTKGKRTELITVGFRNKRKEFTVTIDRDMGWDIQEREQRNPVKKEGENEYFTMRYTVLKNNIGLLKIRHFMDDDFYRLFDSLYPRILASDALIIDLRDNRGGRSNYADYIIRHLSDKPVPIDGWSSPMYIPAHVSWNYPREWYASAPDFLNPVDKEIYKKKVVVLVNAGTFSSAENFCALFRGMKRGKIVGVPTGGSTGNGVRLTLLEDLMWVNICSMKENMPDGTAFVRVGIQPDIEMEETVEAFLTNKDNVLEKAARFLQ